MGRPDELKEKIRKQSESKKRNREDPTAKHRGAKKKHRSMSSVLTETEDLKAYVPKTRDTRYDEIIVPYYLLSS